MTTSIPTAALKFPPLPVFLSGRYDPVSDLLKEGEDDENE
jgi:hypothetical protein